MKTSIFFLADMRSMYLMSYSGKASRRTSDSCKKVAKGFGPRGLGIQE